MLFKIIPFNVLNAARGEGNINPAEVLQALDSLDQTSPDAVQAVVRQIRLLGIPIAKPIIERMIKKGTIRPIVEALVKARNVSTPPAVPNDGPSARPVVFVQRLIPAMPPQSPPIVTTIENQTPRVVLEPRIRNRVIEAAVKYGLVWIPLLIDYLKAIIPKDLPVESLQDNLYWGGVAKAASLGIGIVACVISGAMLGIGVLPVVVGLAVYHIGIFCSCLIEYYGDHNYSDEKTILKYVFSTTVDWLS